MYPNFKRNFCIYTFTALFAVFTIVSCSKEDPKITHYQLEGTWQLYRTYSENADSTYEPSQDNQIIFSPKIYWHYADALLTDSGSYTLTEATETADAFKANIHYISHPFNGLYIHGDTLRLTDSATVDSVQVFIKKQPI